MEGPHCRKVSPVGGEDIPDLQPLGDGHNGRINEPYTKFFILPDHFNTAFQVKRGKVFHPEFPAVD